MALTTTTLAAACGVNDTTIRVTSATGFVPQQLIRIEDEMLAQSGAGSSGTTISTRRGIEGTIPAAHPSGATVATGQAIDFAAPPPGEILAPPASAAGGTLRGATMTLTHAQILTLPSTPIEIVVAPGGTHGLVFLQGVVANHVAVSYTNRQSAAVFFKDPSTGASLSVIDEMANAIRILGSNEGYFVQCPPYSEVNATMNYIIVGGGTFPSSSSSIALGASNVLGNFTGGAASNRLTVTVLYQVYDMATGQFV